MSGYRQVTITDVARAAGVSIRTVSRVLNDSPKVADAARARIKAVIAEVGFSPSGRARAMAFGRSSLIGVVQGDSNAHLIGVFQRGIVDICGRAGYELVVHPAAFGDPGLTADIEGFVRRSRIDGLIVLPPVSEVTSLPPALAALGVPAVAIASVRLPGYPASLITEERVAAGLLADHLAALGHRRIAIITGPMHFRSAVERFDGFSAGLAAHGLTLPGAYVRDGDYGFAAGFAAGTALLDLDDPPTAIFASNDFMAAGAIKAAHARGIVVPDGLTVAGFDDSDIAAMISPALTTIRRPLLDMAHTATTRLLAMIDTRSVAVIPDYSCTLSLIERQSTASPPGS